MTHVTPLDRSRRAHRTHRGRRARRLHRGRRRPPTGPTSIDRPQAHRAAAAPSWAGSWAAWPRSAPRASGSTPTTAAASWTSAATASSSSATATRPSSRRCTAEIDTHPLASRVFLEPVAARAAQALAAHTPPGLDYVHFVNSGAEATEAALKLARAHGRTSVITTRRGFHGKTLGALSVTANATYQTPFQPLLPDVTQVAYDDPADLEQALARPARPCLRHRRTRPGRRRRPHPPPPAT
ncbi:Acetylornithine/succinyldiaminopimelate aminotransferase [Streptomyces tendae]